MRTRPLGNTGIEVSEICLGTWGLSGDAYGAMIEPEIDRVIDKAVALGVTLFDTADVYGNGSMEKRLGERLPKESTYLVTKLGTDRTSKPAVKRFDVDYLRDAFERSRDRIGREKIDVVLLHNPSMHALSRPEPTEFLRELVRLGAIRAWGVSAGSDEVARAAITEGAGVIELAYSAVFPSDLHAIAGDVVERNVGVLARSILAHGLLGDRWAKERDFVPDDHRSDRWTRDEFARREAQRESLRPLVKGDIKSIRTVAVKFVLANQVVSSAVIGPRSTRQLDELCEDAAGGPPYLKDTALAELSARLKGAGVRA